MPTSCSELALLPREKSKWAPGPAAGPLPACHTPCPWVSLCTGNLEHVLQSQRVVPPPQEPLSDPWGLRALSCLGRSCIAWLAGARPSPLSLF